MSEVVTQRGAPEEERIQQWQYQADKDVIASKDDPEVAKNLESHDDHQRRAQEP